MEWKMYPATESGCHSNKQTQTTGSGKIKATVEIINYKTSQKVKAGNGKQENDLLTPSQLHDAILLASERTTFESCI